ncbi:Uncharacterised protein [Enterobacter cloacae]|nr:Uncharacterised protein [Enterobacter cloacae]
MRNLSNMEGSGFISYKFIPNINSINVITARILEKFAFNNILYIKTVHWCLI